MSHDWVLWVLVACSAVHVVEEHAMGWQGWAAGAIAPRIGVIPTWTDFWATNGLLIVFGISAAAVGWRAPAWALGFPALCLINALAFHVVPSLATRRPNPGLFTACLLYLPVGIWCYAAAAQDHVLDLATVLGSLAIGAVAMGAAIGLLVLGNRFHYANAS